MIVVIYYNYNNNNLKINKINIFKLFNNKIYVKHFLNFSYFYKVNFILRIKRNYYNKLLKIILLKL